MNSVYNFFMAPKDKFHLVLKILLPGFIFCFLFYYFKSLLIQPYAPLLETPFTTQLVYFVIIMVLMMHLQNLDLIYNMVATYPEDSFFFRL